MNRTILTEQIWQRIQPFLPAETRCWGRPSKSHRMTLVDT